MRTAMGMFLAGTLAILIGLLGPSPARGDETDLSNGVFIAHHPPTIQFSNPPEGWCQYYLDNLAIHCCSAQNPRIDVDPGDGAVWFVLSAWDEEKRFCGCAFGLADYNPGLFAITDWNYCCQADECLELPTDGWPGPVEGTAVVRAEVSGDWHGNFVPVYWFAGYAYGEGLIPLGIDPRPPPLDFSAVCYGALGVSVDGIECCPEGGPSPARPTTWGVLKSLYR